MSGGMTQPMDAQLKQVAERLGALPEDKQVTFLRQLREKGVSLSRLPILREGREHAPLSAAQARLWFLWQMEPHSAAYNIPAAVRLRGALDEGALERAFTALIARHESLRTVFRSAEDRSRRADGEVLQCILPPGPAHLEAKDFSSEAEARQWLNDCAQRSFDLAQGPLLRLHLARLPGEALLLVNLHHIIADGWSIGVLIDEFAALYSAEVQGTQAELEALPIQYSDIARWQRLWLAAGEGERQLAYWKEQLGDESLLLTLPGDRPRPLVQSYRGATLDFELPRVLSDSLRDLARGQGATLFMLILAAYQLLLSRYSGQRELRVGVPIAGRGRAESERLIGFFVNTQVLSARIDGDESFNAFLARTRESVLGAQANPDLPFEQLVDALQPERSLSYNPLFQVACNHQPSRRDALRGLPGGLQLESLELDSGIAKFDLTLNTEESRDGQVRGQFMYATDQFDAATIERLGGHFLNLLQALVRDPQCPVTRLPLLGGSEREQLLCGWNATAMDYPRDACLHQLIEQQVQRSPAEVALTDGRRSFSYAELNSRANRLAHWLREQGVGPDSRVGVALERSVELLVALLAVLKAGGAYVPLDPEFPAERLAHMLEDGGVRLLLTQQHLLGELPQRGARAFCLDRDWGQLESYADSDLTNLAKPDDLAYVIYTSGSTGKPKGVAVRHGGVVNFMLSMAREPGLDARDRVLALTSLSFDISALELYLPLLVGGRVVLIDRDVARDPSRLLGVALEQGVTVIQATPSTWTLLSGHEDFPRLTGCRFFCGGEALSAELADKLTAQTDALWNLYGPTETTIWSAAWKIEKGARALLGKPIANTQLYILDGELQPAPIGVAGELYIAGDGLARGYHGRPGLTCERFVADPYGRESGARMYRTGDLARWRADGVLEYLGRIDHQVKIRGFRIELGEIESRLLGQPGVREAVVIARDAGQVKQLVGYVTGPLLSEQGSDLRAALLEELPDYMVPAQIVPLERMPLTPNGKLDRKALPEPDFSLLQKTYRAPQSEREQTLAVIWCAVLGLERVGLEDNFFELGGDSIVSIQVVSRARAAGLQLSPKDLFQHQTLQALARVAGDLIAAEAPAAVAAIEVPNAAQLAALGLSPDQIEDLYPLSPMQQGMLFHGVDGSEGGVYVNQLRVEVQDLDVERFRAAWQAALDAHDNLRAGVHWQGLDKPVQAVHKHVQLPLEVLDWRGREDMEAALDELAVAERSRSFDLERPPLLRLVLVRSAEASHQLVYTHHHILLDGWSNAQLFAEALRRYNGESIAVQGRYRDYIHWLQVQDPQRAQDFWSARLQGFAQPTVLADSLARPAEGSGHGLEYSRYDAAATESLKAFARSQWVTLNTLVQAAWILLLQRYTGQQRVTFGATVAGRPAQLAGADSLLGLFINTLPIVQAPAEHADLGDWLRELQAYNLEVREFEYTPLYDIQRWAGQTGQALFDSIIVFENYPVDEALRSTQGLRFGELKSKDETSMPMDLAVRVGERLEIEYQYLRAHFNAAAVARLRGNMEQVLDSLLHGAGKRVGELQCLSASDREALAACRGPHQSLPPAEPVHLAIARQASLRGDEVALICGDEEVDYAALERDSNRLAHRLMALGVGPEVRVGVALPRSVRIPLALLAVLKAGGAYVPLDAEYPRERLEFQMDDAGIALLITDSRLRERLPLPVGVTCLELDSLYGEHLDLTGEDSDLPVVALEPENLAYLIYTSGSTGKPKGVAVSHGPLAMHCAAIGELYKMDASTRELHFMSFAFDGAHERWLTTLVHGGSLVLRGDELWTPEQTYRVLHDKQVSVAAFPPVYLQQLAEHALRDGNPPPVRIYCFGGDAVPNASFELARRALRAEHLINGYGPTETVVTPLLWKADRATSCDAAYAPIGRGVGARKLYILDEQLRQVPLGVAGELYIGGDGLARGYHERAGLTAERFVADPFDAQGGRLYRSGDLVRGRADGVIDYVGRIDHQVKIRGFRIELGEIEARLQDHPQVSEALVVARDGVSGKQLVGYVVGDPESNVQGDALRSFLREQVPDYMVPAQILRLERFPLSPNGKIDRQALPEPTWQGEAYEAPRNERERALAEIWQDVLQVERVGIRDNFFDLGGDSILSLQIVSRARQALGEGVEIRLRDLLQYQTIAGLLERAESVVEAAPTATVAVADDGESFGLVPIQQWMFEQQLEEPNHFNQAVLLECRQRLDAGALEAALQGLLAEHGSLRLSFTRGADGQWRQRYREASEITGALLWQRQAANAEEALLIANQAQRSLDLSKGRLLRGVLTDMVDGTQRLLLVIHHLGVDGVSWRILLEELQQRYAAQLSGEPAPRLERTCAYRAWAEGLRDYADSQLAQADLPYWLEQTEIAGLGEPQRDNPRGAERMAHLEQLSLRLDRQQTQRLLKVAPQAYRTQINDLLLTALGRTLCQWCDSESVLIGLEGHGREDILDEVDHSRTLGWFTSLFPLRLTPGQGDYAQAIPAIRRQLRAVPDRGIGYGALRYLGDSALRRQLAGRAEPRVTFNYLGQFDQSFDDKALFMPLQEKPGDTYAPSTPMNNWLEIVGQVYDGELTLRCMFSRRVFRPSRIEVLMTQLRTELEGVISHCCAQVESAARKEQVTL